MLQMSVFDNFHSGD